MNFTSTEELYASFLKHPSVCTDSRKITPNCLFFALSGPNFDGNSFASAALEAGAAYSIIDKPEWYIDGQTFLVPDVLTALQDLAKYHRSQRNIPIISLTGSNGKTTTKELIAAVLAQKFKVVATQGNLNNHIGVPLTLLSMNSDTEIGVVEMGANHQGEIKSLCDIAQPNYGYITNFGKAHLEGFGGVEGVIKGKSELYQAIAERNEHIFYRAEDPIQEEKLAHYTNKTSIDPGQFPEIELSQKEPTLVLSWSGLSIKTQLFGDYNFVNLCAAIRIGTYFGVPIQKIAEALSTYTPNNNRSQTLKRADYTLVLDAYNANPSSMNAALQHLAQIDVPKKTVVLGDMFELGDTAAQEHQYIAELATSIGIDQVILVGHLFAGTTTSAKTFRDIEQLKSALSEIDLSGHWVLIKGSRGMALERLLEVI
ncbi:MAG: UDP-N-acetylmuramoyl-tripeptide--D-alanyl-D-alanine ligase [Flavobacteriaceae bacterium]